MVERAYRGAGSKPQGMAAAGAREPQISAAVQGAEGREPQRVAAAQGAKQKEPLNPAAQHNPEADESPTAAADRERKPRIFVAVPIGEAAAAVLADWAQRTFGAAAFRRWTDLRDYHVTLKFLGDVEQERIPAIVHALGEAMERETPFALNLIGAGTFGLPEAPRVLFAEPDEGSVAHLGRLAAAAEAALAPLGFAPEKRSFRAHVTLARKYAAGQAFEPPGLAAAPAVTAGVADRAVLYRTHMHERPMYERIAEFPFGGGY
ncbi:RNA 2',3'-cyclic phosphodiesterase [Saccharibacillus sp. O16]|nr:RNA 2',3'-cyclic phosphodiesterase [Saccharibacillus sp. O16]